MCAAIVLQELARLLQHLFYFIAHETTPLRRLPPPVIFYHLSNFVVLFQQLIRVFVALIPVIKLYPHVYGDQCDR